MTLNGPAGPVAEGRARPAGRGEVGRRGVCRIGLSFHSLRLLSPARGSDSPWPLLYLLPPSKAELTAWLRPSVCEQSWGGSGGREDSCGRYVASEVITTELLESDCKGPGYCWGPLLILQGS